MAELGNVIDPDEQAADGHCGAHINGHGLTCPKKAEYKIRFWDVQLGTNFDVMACADHAADARENHEVLKITNLREGRTEV